MVKQQKQRTMATSTLQVQKPLNYSILESKYKLIRYVVPNNFHSKKNKYALLHIELRSQLSVPYLLHTHDKLDRGESVVIYALYPRNNNHIQPLQIKFLSDDYLPNREIRFEQIQLFNIVKLIQAEYFKKFPHFASNGSYFIHAHGNSDDWHICMEIKIQGARHNIGENDIELDNQEFWITGQAKKFHKVTKHPDAIQIKKYPYYIKKVQGDLVVFKQLPTEKIDEHQNHLFTVYSSKSSPARLAYHAQSSKDIQPCRGYLLHQFIKSFIAKLNNLGIPTSQKKRNWLEYKIQGNSIELPHRLQRVYIYDNRRNKITRPIQHYQTILANHYQDLEFIIVDDIANTNKQPVLILQDTSENDYLGDEDNENGIHGLFYGQKDPYQIIYEQYKSTPKQSININQNSEQPKRKKSPHNSISYLDYPMIDLSHKKTHWAVKFQVCLHQLAMKDIVMNQIPVSDSLPFGEILAPLINYVYIRKVTYKDMTDPYCTMMYIENSKLVFHDLRDPDAKKVLREICSRFGYSWTTIEEKIIKKHRRKKEDDITSYDIILMPNMVVEIEEVAETIIFDYDEIQARLDARNTKRPVSEFKLYPHYEKIKSKNLTLGQVEEYDILIDKISRVQTHVSYNELATQILNKEMGQIFGLPTASDAPNVRYNTNRLLGYYKKIWGTGGGKGNDVQLSQGIWFDETDLSYFVLSQLPSLPV